MNSVVNLKEGFITFNSNIDYSLSFSKCAIGYSNYNINSHERGSLVFLTNNNANDANISMNSDIRMCIASDGNVGIGTNNPVNKLDVNGSINIPTGSKYKINNYNLAFSNIDGTLPAAGIGTSGTLGGVKVDGSTIAINNNVISATAQVNSDWNEISTASKAFIRNKPSITSSQWTTNGTNIYYSTGNIGIGTTNPETKLDVDGNLLIRAYAGTSGTNGIFFRSGFATTNQYNCSILTFDHSSGGANDGISINGFQGVSFCTGANTRQERMRIDGGGRVGIGTTNSPLTKQIG